MGVVQIFVSCLLLIFYSIINGPLILKKKWRETVEENRRKNCDDLIEIDDHSELKSKTLLEL